MRPAQTMRFEFQALVDGEKNQVVGADIDMAQATRRAWVKLEISSMIFWLCLDQSSNWKGWIGIEGISATDEKRKSFDFSILTMKIR